MGGVRSNKRKICCSDYNNTSLRLKVSLFLKWERYLPSCCKIWLPHLYKPILIPITYKLVNYISNYSTKQYHESLLWALKDFKNANKILPIAFLVMSEKQWYDVSMSYIFCPRRHVYITQQRSTCFRSKHPYIRNIPTPPYSNWLLDYN